MRFEILEVKEYFKNYNINMPLKESINGEEYLHYLYILQKLFHETNIQKF